MRLERKNDDNVPTTEWYNDATLGIGIWRYFVFSQDLNSRCSEAKKTLSL